MASDDEFNIQMHDCVETFIGINAANVISILSEAQAESARSCASATSARAVIMVAYLQRRSDVSIGKSITIRHHHPRLTNCSNFSNCYLNCR